MSNLLVFSINSGKEDDALDPVPLEDNLWAGSLDEGFSNIREIMTGQAKRQCTISSLEARVVAEYGPITEWIPVTGIYALGLGDRIAFPANRIQVIPIQEWTNNAKSTYA